MLATWDHGVAKDFHVIAIVCGTKNWFHRGKDGVFHTGRVDYSQGLRFASWAFDRKAGGVSHSILGIDINDLFVIVWSWKGAKKKQTCVSKLYKSRGNYNVEQELMYLEIVPDEHTMASPWFAKQFEWPPSQVLMDRFEGLHPEC